MQVKVPEGGIGRVKRGGGGAIFWGEFFGRFSGDVKKGGRGWWRG